MRFNLELLLRNSEIHQFKPIDVQIRIYYNCLSRNRGCFMKLIHVFSVVISLLFLGRASNHAQGVVYANLTAKAGSTSNIPVLSLAMDRFDQWIRRWRFHQHDHPQ